MSKHPPSIQIMPPERRQALQARIGLDVPRYARAPEAQRPYVTHHALEAIERAVEQGLLPGDVLDSDYAVLGAVLGRSWEREAQDGLTLTVPAWLKQAPEARCGVLLWAHTYGELALLPEMWRQVMEAEHEVAG